MKYQLIFIIVFSCKVTFANDLFENFFEIQLYDNLKNYEIIEKNEFTIQKAEHLSKTGKTLSGESLKGF